MGSFDIAVIDTPPERNRGSLPGVLLVAPINGADAVRNLLVMLSDAPKNTDIVLVWTGEEDREEWADNVNVISRQLGRPLDYLPDPVKPSKLIKEAHDEQRSVWTLPRKGNVLEFLNAVNDLAELAIQRIDPQPDLRPMPRPASSQPYLPGWDDET
jgi:hypothetical protein